MAYCDICNHNGEELRKLYETVHDERDELLTVVKRVNEERDKLQQKVALLISGMRGAGMHCGSCVFAGKTGVCLERHTLLPVERTCHLWRKA